MKAISEAELADFVRNKAVKRMYIVQGANARYQIIVTLTWKSGDWNLVNAKKKPRQWASLDRLTRHIINEYGNELPPINLVLYSKEMEDIVTYGINDMESLASWVPEASRMPNLQLKSDTLIQKDRRVFAYNFKRARKAAGLTQDALSRITGLTQAFLSDVENAKSTVSLDNASALAEAVGHSLLQLLTPLDK
jgi:DNA-binding XRE family transcriptional regulator